MPRIILSDERLTTSIPIAVNGRIQFIPVGVPTLVDDEIFEAIQASSAAFSIADEEGGLEGGVSSEPPSEDAIEEKPAPKRRRKPTSKKG